MSEHPFGLIAMEAANAAFWLHTLAQLLGVSS